MEIVAFEGWPKVAKLVSGSLEAYVSLDFGPRVLRLGFAGGPNFFAVYDRHKGLSGGDTYRSYGGHRLWTAPEVASRTYEADNQPVLSEALVDGGVRFTTPLGPTQLQRSITITPLDEREGFIVDHEVRNLGPTTVEIAAWALSVMAPGGVCLFPQHEFVSHKEALLPARPVVMWSYTKMSDSRWTWGDQVIRLRQDAGMSAPQKIGALVSQGYAAYALHGGLFFKRFGFEEDAPYPDFGVNFEAYTRDDMLEVESLSPLTVLEPGYSIPHREVWYALPSVKVPESDEDCADWLAMLASSHPYLP